MGIMALGSMMLFSYALCCSPVWLREICCQAAITCWAVPAMTASINSPCKEMRSDHEQTAYVRENSELQAS